MVRGIGRFGSGDVLLAVGFAAAAAAEVLVRSDGDLPAVVLGLGGALAMVVLVVRRRRPLLAMSLFCLPGVCATWIQARFLHTGDEAFVPILTLIVLSYSLGAYAGRRALFLGVPQPVALVVVVDLMEPGQSVVGATIFVSVFVVLLPGVAGRLVRVRRELVAELDHLERAAGFEHRRRLRMVRVEESLAVAAMLDRTLESGLEQLLGVEDIEDVEGRARALLAITRDTVVRLARDDAEEPDASTPVLSSRWPVDVKDSPGVTWAPLVAAGVGAGLLTETGGGWSHTGVALALTAVLVGSIVTMAHHPMVGALLAWSSATAFSRAVVPLGNTFTGIGLTVAIPFLASWLGERRRGAIAVVAGLAAAVAGVRMSDPVGAAVLTAFATIAGAILRDRSALLAEVRAARAEAMDRRRNELRIVALEERAALGRELHDSVGHALTVIALQAGAARRLEAVDPPAAAGARQTIERTAREALDDLRRGFEATPSTIERLVSTARSAGLDVTVDGSPPPAELAGMVFRVVQEALTNALRHAPGTQVRIELGPAAVDAAYACTISNSVPRITPAAFPSAGRGLPGMRARLAAIGGTVTWGPTEGGFVVSAMIPSTGEPAR
jgi:signal transduction histidine kinase